MTESDELGSLPASWERTRVDAVGEVDLGKMRSPNSRYGPNMRSYLRVANVLEDQISLDDLHAMDFTPEEFEHYVVRPGDILLNEGQSPELVGRPALFRGGRDDLCFQNSLLRFRAGPDIDPEFALIVFRHFLHSGIFRRRARWSTNIAHLSRERFCSMFVPIPPKAEQVRIVALVSAHLEELAAARRSLSSALARVEEQTSTIFAAAVRGELVAQGAAAGEGAQPPHRRGAQPSLFPSTGTRSPGLPRGWRQVTVGDAGLVALGKAREPARHFGANMKPYLRVANVFEDRIDVSHVLTMHFDEGEYDTLRLRPGDILLNEGQSPDLVGRPAMFRDELPGACFQNSLIRFRASEDVDPAFALLVFRHYLRSGAFRAKARWSTNIAHLSLQRFLEMSFPLPPMEEQQRIVEEAQRRVHASSSQESAIRASLERLPLLEAEILSAASTGRLQTQEPGDVPVRLSPPANRKPQSIRTGGRKRAGGANAKGQLVKTMTTTTGRQSLESVLRESGGRLPLPDLLFRAGFNKDITADIEEFYLVLRRELGRTVRVVEGGENAVVEVVSHAS